MGTTSPQTTLTGRLTFVIGDVHGHLDRLKALLDKADVGTREVVQLGDLGHYGITQSQRADADTWAFAQDHISHALWGNHDYAIFNSQHIFGGYQEPFYETLDLIKRFVLGDRMHLALERHGFLLTHAGLHKSFKAQHVDPAIKADPKRFVEWVEECEQTRPVPPAFVGVRDAISSYRGGGANAGGILWRDAREKLYPEFRQIFGHTAKSNHIRKYQGKTQNDYSYCIDVGTKTNGCLAGIWLPSEEIVSVQVH